MNGKSLIQQHCLAAWTPPAMLTLMLSKRASANSPE
jgi:hypothetical protein